MVYFKSKHGMLREALQLDKHTAFLVAHAIIVIVWILLGERLRAIRNVEYDFHFILAAKGFSDCL